MDVFPRGRAAVVVLGDVGRSPRMQYHALSLADEAELEVDVIGYAGSPPHTALLQHPRIHLHLLAPPFTNKLPRFLYLPALFLKLLIQTLSLLWTLCVTVPPPDVFLLQNPPTIPTFTLVQLACWLRGSLLIIDWHNFGYTLLGLTLGPRHPLVRIHRWYERRFGIYAAGHLCVTKAMQHELEHSWGIRATVLYDRPPEMFRPTTVEEKHQLFVRLHTSIIHPPFAARGDCFASPYIINDSLSPKGLPIGHPSSSYRQTNVRNVQNGATLLPSHQQADARPLQADSWQAASGSRHEGRANTELSNGSHGMTGPGEEAELGQRGTEIGREGVWEGGLERGKEEGKEREEERAEEREMVEETVVTRRRVLASSAFGAGVDAEVDQTELVELREDRPAVLVSSTSWTADEDFSLFLEAAVLYDQRVKKLLGEADDEELDGGEPHANMNQEENGMDGVEVRNANGENGSANGHVGLSNGGRLSNGGQRANGTRREKGSVHFPRLLCIITGKGPLRSYYEAKIANLRLKRVAFRTLWLTSDDYPLLLGAADLGVCLHASSSGLDLPMKVVDMFGCGLPVVARAYSCIDELIQHGQNGLLFSSSFELADLLVDLFRDFIPGEISPPPTPNPSSPLLGRLRSGALEASEAGRWAEEWSQHVLPLLLQVSEPAALTRQSQRRRGGGNRRVR
eukprot:TRINITY_DN16799_c0_g1_i1.p1 TRINITY_DN16799_c0_g1~~TRINITY_DN16799_c0_g1_i1.p1  ORF type:complete len:683 (-),score=141.96 TRINITY_DN16799_c0_g1_i1:1053-3101(-)